MFWRRDRLRALWLLLLPFGDKWPDTEPHGAGSWDRGLEFERFESNYSATWHSSLQNHSTLPRGETKGRLERLSSSSRLSTRRSLPLKDTHNNTHQPLPSSVLIPNYCDLRQLGLIWTVSGWLIASLMGFFYIGASGNYWGQNWINSNSNCTVNLVWTWTGVCSWDWDLLQCGERVLSFNTSLRRASND